MWFLDTPVTVTSGGQFEEFVLRMARPAEKDELPPHSGPPSPEAAEELAKVAAEHNIKLVGPPLR